MANEFIARNGLIALNNTIVSGSFNVSGSIEIPNSYYLNTRSTAGALINVFRIDTGNNFVFSNTGSGDFYFYEGANVLARFINGGVINLGGTSATNNPTMKITTTGVGIGTGGLSTLTARLQVSGSASQVLMRADSDVSSSIFFVSGSGNVGIGTTTPTQKLTVGSADSHGILINAGGKLYLRDTVTYINEGSGLNLVSGATRNIRFNAGGSDRMFVSASGNVGIGITTPSTTLNVNGTTLLQGGQTTVRGSGTTSATTTFLLQNSTPVALMTVQDNGQYTIGSPLMILPASQSGFLISQSISSSATVGAQVYGVNITPVFYQTTASQTETAFRVAATFTQSSAAATSGSNIIADFGATSVGSQLTVTDVTSGSIYMVNDVSGLPIIEATSDWTVNMYNFPSIVLQKTGSQVNINGTLRVSGSFILPLSQSTAPQTGSAYWSGSFLFIWDGSQYRSSSFA